MSVNVRNFKVTDRLFLNGHSNIKCVVQERLFGEELWFSMMNGVLTAADGGGRVDLATFCNANLVRDSHESKLEILRQRILDSAPKAKLVIVKGIMIGGTYPHPTVKSLNDVDPLYKGVYYAPDIEWMATAIEVDEVELPKLLTNRLLGDCGIEFAPVLFTGKLNKCIAMDTNFVTGIPEALGYPKIDENKAAGIVITPTVTTNWNSTSTSTIKIYKSRLLTTPTEVSSLPKPTNEGQAAVLKAFSYLDEEGMKLIIKEVGTISKMSELVSIGRDYVIKLYVTKNIKGFAVLSSQIKKEFYAHLNFKIREAIRGEFRNAKAV